MNPYTLIGMQSVTRILYLDDETELLSILQDAFQDYGIRLDVAQNVAEAKRHLSINHYDLVITDLLMPRENGNDLINFLKNTESKPKILVLTGDESKKVDISKEVDKVLLKPMKVEEIWNAVLSLLPLNR